MSPRASLVLGLLLVGSSASCTVLEDMNGYTGGPEDASSTGDDVALPADAEVGADGAIDDASMPPSDTGVADSGGSKNDTSPADTFAPDTSAPDTSATDTLVPDTSATDTFVPDTSVPDTAAVDSSVADASSCGAALLHAFGLSELMVRAASGIGDKREWLELTNYTSGSLDVSGVTVKIVGGGIEKASLTFPSGTVLAAAGAVVVAVDKATFTAELTAPFTAIKVYDFAKIADVMTNTTPFEVRVLGAGCTTPYETVTVSRGTWPTGQSFAYPPPSASCSVAGRFTATATLSAPWKDATKDAANLYANQPADGGTVPLYGTPGKPNTGVACP